MKTTKICIRPFKPCMKDEEADGREPYAVLTFGNIRVEIDYTIFRSVCLDDESPYMANTCGVFGAATEEILKEMYAAMNGEIPKHHRDTDTPYTADSMHNPLHPRNGAVKLGRKAILKTEDGK